jgi:STAS-like domain of unknown function (DUF4325)
MPEEITVRLLDIIGSPLAVSAEDGQLVHDKIAPLLHEGQCVVLSFDGVNTVISAFLNAAVGQLYGKFSEDKIRELLTVADISQEDIGLLKHVVENAKAYFRDPERYRRAVRPLSEDEHEE